MHDERFAKATCESLGSALNGLTLHPCVRDMPDWPAEERTHFMMYERGEYAGSALISGGVIVSGVAVP